MRNKLTVLLVLSLVLFVVIGCNLGGLMGSKDSSEKTQSNTANTESADSPTSDTTSADSKSTDTDSTKSDKTDASDSGDIVKVGIAECDELATYINNNSEAIGQENIVVRGIVEMYKQTIFSNLRDSAKDMNEEQKTKMGENCKTALDNLKKQMKQ